MDTGVMLKDDSDDGNDDSAVAIPGPGGDLSQVQDTPVDTEGDGIGNQGPISRQVGPDAGRKCCVIL